VINYVTLRGANGCLRVALAPCGRHSCDPRKLDVQFFFYSFSGKNVTSLLHPNFEESDYLFYQGSHDFDFHFD